MTNWDVKGQRVRLIFTSDPYTKLKTGALGTASHYDDFGTFHVKWDDGSHLGLSPGADVWEIVSSTVAV